MSQLRPLRRDAAENRERVLGAAKQVFGEHGLNACMDEVARVAGVGIGTLYRRFPTKQALIDELIGQLRPDLLAVATAASERADGTGLEALLVSVGELQAEQSRYLQQLWDLSDAELDSVQQFRDRLAVLLKHAQQAGRIRSEVVATDVSMMFWSLRGVIETTRENAPQAWRRHLELLVAGLRPAHQQWSQSGFTQPPLLADQLPLAPAADSAAAY